MLAAIKPAQEEQQQQQTNQATQSCFEGIFVDVTSFKASKNLEQGPTCPPIPVLKFSITTFSIKYNNPFPPNLFGTKRVFVTSLKPERLQMIQKPNYTSEKIAQI